MISVIIPTRGLIRGKTIESVFRELKGKDYNLIIADQLPLPDCFNEPVKKAFFNSPDYVWFVEEDVEIPLGGLDSMLKQDADVSCIDYPLSTGQGCTAWYKGKLLWCGMGCTLIKSHVFSKLHYPYFRTDYSLIYDEVGFRIEKAPKKSYGGQDIYFGLKVNLAGMTMKCVPNTTAKHHKVEKDYEKAVNGSVYEFKVYDTIKKTTTLEMNPLEYIDKIQFSDV